MNKKRVAALAAACLVAAGLLSSCGRQEKPQETSLTETTTAPPDFDGWSGAYEEYMLSVVAGGDNLEGYKYEPEECRFGIIDLDNSGVPELLISEGEYPASKVNIYIYDGYNVKSAGSAGSGGEIRYEPEKGRLYSYELLEDSELYQETRVAYMFTGDEVVKTWQGTTRTADESLVPVDCEEDYGDKVTYLSGETETDAAEYRRLYEENIPADDETFGRNGFKFDRDNIISVCENGVVSAGTEESTAEQNTEGYAFDGEIDAAARDAYKKVLTDYYNSADSTPESVFSFAYIDGDDVPELLVAESDSRSSGVRIYTIGEEGAVLACTAGEYGVVGYAEKEGIILNTYSGSGVTSITVYKLENGAATVVWEGTEITNYDDGGNETGKEYEAAGVSVTKEEFDSQYGQYSALNLKYNTDDGEKGADAYGYELTDENIEAALGTASEEVTGETTVI